MSANHKSRSDRLSSALTVFLLVALTVVLWQLISQNRALKAGGTTASGVEELKPGDDLPVIALSAADGTVAPLSGIVSGRSGVLAFLMTNCGSCEVTRPLWTELHAALADDGVPFYGLSLDGIAAVREYVSTHQLAWPVYSVDLRQNAYEGLGIRGVPTTVVYSADGKVMKVWQGRLTPELVDEIRSNVLAAYENASNAGK